MSLIYQLAEIIDDCRREYENILQEMKEKSSFERFKTVEIYGSVESAENNILARGDNLQFMNYLASQEQFRGKIKLIYADPPFFSKADYAMQIKINTECMKGTTKLKQTVYTDLWKEGMESYLRMIGIRLFMMRDLLTENGCIWMHLDWHVVHYVKVLMDEIFGMDNFVNEIIWNYKSGGTSSRRFARKHDTLLFYGKGDNYYFTPQKEKSYNRGFKPYRFKGVEEFQDEVGWYTLVNMKDVWQLDMVGRTSSERTGYATQKPELLLERILKSCTQEGDLCADFFGGSGTLAAVAHKMERRWITCDVGKIAIAGIKKRALQRGAKFMVLKENTEEKETGSLQADIETQEDSLCVRLHSYRLSEEYIKNMGQKEQETVSTIVRKDSLSLIDYWSVDFNYNGKIHMPEKILQRDKTILERSIAGMSHTGLINVSCVDVFGNVIQKTLKLTVQ
ncbi:MAG: site-specific DNA-methyltransferase [Clostridiales bacterium]|uniref:site-specific DNA-methyltransferase n=1 Tax=Aminipila sp. TaxID=2060095 RepID=UPI001D44248F|nr:site-specific DNA-methyltransferase [Aminipila sp.]MBE6034187.1 site-specific DNA-methyltransferase [Clostridiales bacterium]